MENKVPDIFLVGPMRTGTTWTYRQLSKLGDFDLPRGKEIYFFDNNFDKGIDWYLEQFNNDGRPKIDISPTYFSNTMAPERIRQVNPKSKIFITLRNPLELLISSYGFCIQNAKFDIAFSDYIKSGAINEFRYKLHVRRWIEEFGLERLRFLLYSEFLENKALYLSKIYAEASVDIHYEKLANMISLRKENPSGRRLKYPKLYRLMVRMFGPALRGMLGRDFLGKVKDSPILKGLYVIENPTFKVSSDELEYLKNIFCEDIEYLKSITADVDIGFMEL